MDKVDMHTSLMPLSRHAHVTFAETKVTAAVLATLVPPRLRDALQKSFVVRKGRLARSVARNENIEATTDLEIEVGGEFEHDNDDDDADAHIKYPVTGAAPGAAKPLPPLMPRPQQQMFYRNRLLTKTALNGPTASTPVLLESGDACVSDRPLTGINAEISREGSRASRRPPRLVVHNDPGEGVTDCNAMASAAVLGLSMGRGCAWTGAACSRPATSVTSPMTLKPKPRRAATRSGDGGAARPAHTVVIVGGCAPGAGAAAERAGRRRGARGVVGDGVRGSVVGVLQPAGICVRRDEAKPGGGAVTGGGLIGGSGGG